MAITLAANHTYDTLIREDFVIVDFYSTTCVPCRMFSSILEDLEAELPFMNVVKVNITDYPELGEANNIQAVPTVLFYKDGNLLERHLGVIAYDDLKQKISEYMY